MGTLILDSMISYSMCSYVFPFLCHQCMTTNRGISRRRSPLGRPNQFPSGGRLQHAMEIYGWLFPGNEHFWLIFLMWEGIFYRYGLDMIWVSQSWWTSQLTLRDPFEFWDVNSRGFGIQYQYMSGTPSGHMALNGHWVRKALEMLPVINSSHLTVPSLDQSCEHLGKCAWMFGGPSRNL